ARRVVTPWNTTNNYYLASGRNAEGKKIDVMIDLRTALNSWEDRKAAAEEGARIATRPAAERKFAVLSAKFGLHDRWVDVTDPVRGKISGDELEFANPGADLTDPAVGVHKTLAVAYSIDGEVGIRACRDDRPFSLPEGRPITGSPPELWKAELPSPPTAA